MGKYLVELFAISDLAELSILKNHRRRLATGSAGILLNLRTGWNVRRGNLVNAVVLRNPPARLHEIELFEAVLVPDEARVLVRLLPDMGHYEPVHDVVHGLELDLRSRTLDA